MALLDVRNVQKIYRSSFSSLSTLALQDVSFSIERSEFTAIMGESGSGKSTLLHILAGLDAPTSGSVLIDGEDLYSLSAKKRSAFRRNHLGFVFQDYALLDTFTLRDNILLPLVLNRTAPAQMEEKMRSIANELGIQSILNKYPFEISGGQKQRAAAARALICNPDLLLADEPTGALDSSSSHQLLELFERLHARGQTIVMVTHSAMAASFANRVLFIRDGRIFHQIYRGGQSQSEFAQKITDALLLMNRQEHGL